MSAKTLVDILQVEHSICKLRYPDALEVKLSVDGVYELNRLRILVQTNGFEEGEVASILTTDLSMQDVAAKIQELCLKKVPTFERTTAEILEDIFDSQLTSIV